MPACQSPPLFFIFIKIFQSFVSQIPFNRHFLFRGQERGARLVRREQFLASFSNATSRRKKFDEEIEESNTSEASEGLAEQARRGGRKRTTRNVHESKERT